jgi:4-hydroxybenzoate polyprenyltransferase
MREWAKLARVGGSTSAIGSSLLGSFLSNGTWFEHVVIGLISFCLFCGGMIMNDLLDVEKDKKLRPNRPLACGTISITAAKLVLWALIALSLLLAVAINLQNDQLFTIPLTWIAIYGYNGPLKRFDVLAGLSLATARSFNYLIGLGFSTAFIDDQSLLLLPALAIFLHTISILIFSRGEDLEGPVSKSVWVIQVIIALVLFKWNPISAGLWLFMIFTIIFKHKAHDRMIRIKGVGWMVNAFCLLDASVLASTEYYPYAPIWIFLLVIGRIVSKKYPAG